VVVPFAAEVKIAGVFAADRIALDERQILADLGLAGVFAASRIASDQRQILADLGHP
jgi:hypothetical protein